MLRKRLLALLLSGVMMAAALSGCGGDKDSAAPDASGTPDTKLEPLTENLSGPISEEKITLTAMISENSQFNADLSNMAFFELLEEETNVHLEIERVSNQQWAEKLALKLASGNLPDIIGGQYFSVTSDDIARYGGTAFLALNDLIEDNAPNMKKILEENPAIKSAITSADGKIYGMFSYWNELEQNVGGPPFINKKWLDKLGLEMPETTEDLYNVLMAFKTQDPNGNGKNDEIPLSGMDKTLDDFLSKGIGGAFGFGYHMTGAGGINNAGGQYVDIKDGVVRFVPALDEYKEAMKYLNRLWEDGLIDPGIFTTDRPTYIAKTNVPVDEQTVGVGYGPLQEQNEFGYEGAEDYVPLIPVEGPNGDRGYTNQNQAVLQNCMIITTANKHPELTLRYLDRLYAPEWSLQVFEGPIGVAIEEVEDGRYQYMEPAAGQSVDEMRFTTSPISFPFYLPDELINSMFVPDPWVMENTWNNCRQFVPYLIEDPAPSMWPMEQSDAREVANMRMELENLIMIKRGEWITGRSDIEADWDSYVSELNNLGMERYVELYQKSYDFYKAQ